MREPFFWELIENFVKFSFILYKKNKIVDNISVNNLVLFKNGKSDSREEEHVRRGPYYSSIGILSGGRAQ